ncbi:uncharacterized protein LOC111133455 isoform X4 [Crassostrea virginica]
MNQWYRMTRFMNESETQGLVPTVQSQTYVSEWVARTDLRNEGAGQNTDYTQPRSKSPRREKPVLCARHRPYVVEKNKKPPRSSCKSRPYGHQWRTSS